MLSAENPETIAAVACSDLRREFMTGLMENHYNINKGFELLLLIRTLFDVVYFAGVKA